jgi:hypothetical protein
LLVPSILLVFVLSSFVICLVVVLVILFVFGGLGVLLGTVALVKRAGWSSSSSMTRARGRRKGKSSLSPGSSSRARFWNWRSSFGGQEDHHCDFR